MDLNLSRVDSYFLEEAKKAQAENDIEGVMCLMSNTKNLAFIFDNISPLTQCGLYEKALLVAYEKTRTNFSGWPLAGVKLLFRIADRKKLLESGEPLPGDGPFTIYRGVSGRGAARRIRGISWTGSLERAIWFAKRFHLEKPTVFKVVVDKSLIYAYDNGRQEAEFLCEIPDNLKLEKVWPKEKKGSMNFSRP